LSSDQGGLSTEERERIEALGSRYGLSDQAVTSLDALATKLRNDESMPEKWQRTVIDLIEDSLTGLQLEAVTSAGRVADLGTGSGMPGLVLAAAMPDARFTLIDRNLAPIRFVKAAAETMQLDNVEAEVRWVEPWAERNRESFDLVVSRNVRPVNVMAGTATVLKPDGRAVLWAGKKGLREPEITHPDESLGLRLIETRTTESMGKRRYHFIYGLAKSE
jgi:16S rRNA (guanine527-N7)-methyltransferase